MRGLHVAETSQGLTKKKEVVRGAWLNDQHMTAAMTLVKTNFPKVYTWATEWNNDKAFLFTVSGIHAKVPIQLLATWIGKSDCSLVMLFQI